MTTASPLSQEARHRIEEIAGRHGFSADAASTLLVAMQAGGGQMAQFSHPEFGGMGQWSRGGMLMIGDMFNNGLRNRVGSLADELAAALADNGSPFARSLESGGQGSSFGAFAGSPGWPADLGQPSSSGSQNGMRYAVFPDTRRLAIDDGSGVIVYDTGDHLIGGVSQQQGSGRDLSFQSQHGTVRASDLRRVDAEPQNSSQNPSQYQQQGGTSDYLDRDEIPGETTETFGGDAWQDSISSPPAGAAVIIPADAPSPTPRVATPVAGDPLDLIERLAALRDRGVLSDEEFAEKKRELLSRL
ncbi:SHOCT domain-containing protein [Methylobrevis albus]|uniref:SHOCT domain-containing protein n=1 Tax=Methylobrevis albus TaxID=2793297 RepID=A0A931I2D9_9HYPH|nr:SHOCT domain-containing protein [Methylobrevis albus]MBH0238038.1 SHOCT domain-containing protein [Methylobrevis albus]